MMRSLSVCEPVAQGSEEATSASRDLARRAVAVLALILMLPIALFMTLLVLFHLGRPIFFAQTRSGFGNKRFTVWKFRTMRDTVDSDGRPLPDDLRETFVMRIVRRLRLDEIPQLVAIIMGDMAFVGPRPLLPTTVAAFGDAGAARCAVRPGLTGWAQVNGNTRLDERQKLALDLWYINNRSVALDARILMLTATVVLCGERVNPVEVDRALRALHAREASAGRVLA